MAAPSVVSATEWVEYPAALRTSMPNSAAASRSMLFSPVAATQMSRSEGSARSVSRSSTTLLVMTTRAVRQRSMTSSRVVFS